MGFERVSTEAVLKGKVRKEFAWGVICDYRRYPVIMRNVDKVEIIDHTGNEGRSQWFVTIEEAPLTWLEKDYYDTENFELRFESIDGDFESINGKWKVEDLDDGIKIHFDVDYNLGIPVIEEVLGEILKEKMKSNIDSMLYAIKEELTKAQVEERRYERFTIAKYGAIAINGKPIRVYVVNVSRKGMMFYYDGEFDSTDLVVRIGTLRVEAEALYNDVKHKNSRIVFKQAVSAQELTTLIDLFTHEKSRAGERQLVERDTVLSIGAATMPIHLINISPRGMFFKYADLTEGFGEPFDLRGSALSARDIHHDVKNKTMRMVFAKSLDEAEYAAILARLRDGDGASEQLRLSL